MNRAWRAAWYAATAAVMSELTSAVIVRSLKPCFPWLITTADRVPSIPRSSALRHGQRAFDSELGWCRRPFETGTDQTNNGPATFRIDSAGRRDNPGFDGIPATVACFGDSFTFCRLVNDDQTWCHYLSLELDENVANYGVGNYGLDQAELRFERELPSLSAKVAIMGVVPETIARVHSYWKHYFEYGNTLAFKPRFTLAGNHLVLHPPAVRSVSDYFTYATRIEDIQRLDSFYTTKFASDLLSFPYLLGLLRRPRRHLPILGHLLNGIIRGSREASTRKAFRIVLRENARWTQHLYRDPDATLLLRKIVERFAEGCRNNGIEPYLLVIPQPSDLRQVTARRPHEAFFASLGDILPVQDMTARFSAHHAPETLYVNGPLGPHTSESANRLIAAELAHDLSAHVHRKAPR